MTWLPWKHPKLTGQYPDGPQMLGRARAPFNQKNAPLRPLILLIDAALAEEAQSDPRVKYLLELAAVSPIEAHLYSPDGPPSTLAAWTNADSGCIAYEGWAKATPEQPDRFESAAIIRDGSPQAFLMRVPDSEFQGFLPPDARDDERRRQSVSDAKMLLVAKAIHAHIVITSRSLEINTENGFWRNIVVLSPRDALPIMGIYLRVQGRYVFGHSPQIGRPQQNVQPRARDRSWFYWMASKALLPAEYHWSLAIQSHVSNTGDNTLAGFPESITWRLNQVLRSRDRLLALLAVVPNEHSPVDDVLIEFDQILLFLMAAFDITARVAHVALGLSQGSLRQAGWQSPRWLTQVDERDRGPANLVSNNNEGQHVVRIVQLLRNTIHGTAMSANGRIFVVGDHALKPLVPLPAAQRDEFLASVESLGEKDAWGVVQPLPDQELCLHAGDFVEQLVPKAVALLSALMRSTPVDQLPGVGRTSTATVIPLTLDDQRTLWQLGLL